MIDVRGVVTHEFAFANSQEVFETMVHSFQLLGFVLLRRLVASGTADLLACDASY